LIHFVLSLLAIARAMEEWERRKEEKNKENWELKWSRKRRIFMPSAKSKKYKLHARKIGLQCVHVPGMNCSCA